MKLSKKSGFVIGIVIFSVLCMSFIDIAIVPPYFYRAGYKIILFLGLPLLFFWKNKEEREGFRKLFVPQKKDFMFALLLGVGVFGIIMSAYFIFRNFIDFSGIQESLTSGVGVHAENFVYVACYISFVNSLLEEFFFRGFAFLILKKEMGKKFAYIFSAAMFALYHVGMTNGWFNVGIYILAMLGLFAGACIFNFLNEKCENIYPSWLVHMCANFAINTVGFILFGVI